jgi:tetratricopeptide (TPR) repeat protein
MQSIGRYQLLEKLGQGGMGVVYRARDTLLERIVAVKVISAPIDQNAELRERFFREARSAGKLSHKNIITIHDLGEHEGQPYLAMEYLEGQDLLARMAAPQRISLRRKVEIATEICEGLDYAHVHGVVHRDIKPANIFITDGGTVKILDFGLARLVTSELTRSNMMMGTINYMAPEQIRGEKVDHRADIFSTAVVLYELLSGRRAFDADSFAATLYKILQEVPAPLQQIDPTIPPELIHIVDCGLAKARDERYQHMSEMLVDLAVYRQRLTGMDTPGSGETTLSDGRTPSGQPVFLTPAPQTPISNQAPPVSGPATAAVGGYRTIVILAVALLALSVAGVAMWRSTRAAPVPANTAAPAPPATEPTVSELMKSALSAFDAEDFATAINFAEAVLKIDPAHDAARQLRERARRSAAEADEGLRKARDLRASGKFEEASQAAGGVLAVAPGNIEAQQIVKEGAARSRGHGAEEARAQAGRAKTAARAEGAQQMAPGAYGAATAAEREAQRLLNAGRYSEATVKFYDALSLFRTAEIAAQREATAKATAAREAATRPSPPAGENPADTEVSRPAPVTLPPAAPLPAPEQTQAATPGPAAPGPPPPAAPPPAVSAPPAAPTIDNSAAAREAAVAEMLLRYTAAVEARSLDALKRVWPGLSGAALQALRTEFMNTSRISVEIVEPRMSLSADAGTVSFIRRYDVVTVEGQQLHSESQATMDVRRTGSSWVIERIRFIPIR